MSNQNISNHSFTNNSLPPTMASAQKKPFQYGGQPDEDIDIFIKELEQYITVYSLTEDQASYLLKLSLTGPTKTWIKNQPPNLGFRMLIITLRSRFEKEENKLNYIRKLAEEKIRACDNTILDYLDRMQRIAVLGSINEDVLTAMVLKNLPKEWEERIYLRKDRKCCSKLARTL